MLRLNQPLYLAHDKLIINFSKPTNNTLTTQPTFVYMYLLFVDEAEALNVVSAAVVAQREGKCSTLPSAGVESHRPRTHRCSSSCSRPTAAHCHRCCSCLLWREQRPTKCYCLGLIVINQICLKLLLCQFFITVLNIVYLFHTVDRLGLEPFSSLPKSLDEIKIPFLSLTHPRQLGTE